MFTTDSPEWPHSQKISVIHEENNSQISQDTLLYYPVFLYYPILYYPEVYLWILLERALNQLEN